MLQLTSAIPYHTAVRNIIFDFGGVICDLDIQRTVEKFREFGPPKAEFSGNREEQDRLFELLVAAYETGQSSSRQFRDTIRDHYAVPPSDTAIDDAWNAMLAGIPEPRIRMLGDLRNTYRIFLLSNSNEIHYLKYREDLERQYGYSGFDALFEKAYFSFVLHLKKPDPDIFKLVLKENKLDPDATLFIDDTLVHVEAARKTGLRGYHLQEGEEITELFK